MMKKIISLALCLAMILCAACAVAEDGKTEMGLLNVGKAFSIRSVLPEGYTYEPGTDTGLNMVGVLSAGEERPIITVSIGYAEEYADFERFNDLDEAAVEEIRQSFREEDEGLIFEDLETAYGTRLLKVSAAGYVDIYTVYKGYELEFVLTGPFTDADIQMLVDFSSDMDFVTVE